MEGRNMDGNCEVIDLAARRQASSPPPGAYCDLRVGDRVERRGSGGLIEAFKMTAFERDIFDVRWEDGCFGSASHVQLERVDPAWVAARRAPPEDAGDDGDRISTAIGRSCAREVRL